MGGISTEVILGVISGIVAVTVSIVSIIPKLKELGKSKKDTEEDDEENHKVKLEKHPIFLELKNLDYFFRNDFKLPDKGRTELVKDVMLRKIGLAGKIATKYARKIDGCIDECDTTDQCNEIANMTFELFQEMADNFSNPWYKQNIVSYSGKSYDEESQKTLDIYTEKFRTWNRIRTEIAQTASIELPRTHMNDSCYNIMWDMLSIHSYIFIQMKYDAVTTINALNGELTGHFFLGIEIGGREGLHTI